MLVNPRSDCGFPSRSLVEGQVNAGVGVADETVNASG